MGVPIQVIVAPEQLDLGPGALNEGNCYVCGTFSSLEMHHIIPRAYGGTDGPQICLCGVDHTLVHDTSFKLRGRGVPQIVRDRVKELPITQARIAIPMILYLATVIKRSRELTKDDPNKKVKLMATLNKETSRRLRVLTEHWGMQNKDDTLEHLINQTYSRLFLLNGAKQ